MLDVLAHAAIHDNAAHIVQVDADGDVTVTGHFGHTAVTTTHTPESITLDVL